MVSHPAKLNSSELDWLSTIPGYVEGLMSVNDDPVVLDDWQREFLEYQGDSIHKKSRQIGFSFACAAKAIAKSQLNKRNLSVFTSMNLEDAKEKILYADMLHDSVPRKYKSKRVTDNKFEIGFANGSRIVTMFMPRGKGPADPYLDELEYMRDAREIYRAARFMTARGGELTIGSTPLCRLSLFDDIFTEKDGKFKRFRKFSIPWWMSSALCRDVLRASIEAPGMLTEERVYKFGRPALIEIFESTFLEDFQQECELIPLESDVAFIPLDLILDCCDPELEVYKDFDTLAKHVQGELYAGYDVGRRRNPSELFILEQLGDKLYMRMLVTMHNMSFPAQREVIASALEKLPIAKMAIDETGMGMNLAEDMSIFYPHTIVPVNFSGRVETEAKEKKSGDKDKKATVAIKERLATLVKIALERRDITLYRDRDLIDQIHSIKRDVTELGNVRYSVEKNEEHHADKFWALALAIFVSRRRRTSPFILPVFPKVNR